MSQQIEINAELRTDVGKGASRRLRRLADKVPGIIYGGKDNAVPLTMNANELSNVMKDEAFFSQILNVVVNGKGEQAVVRDLQRHPATEKVLHVDFLRISADKAIQVQVPLRFIGEVATGPRHISTGVDRGLDAKDSPAAARGGREHLAGLCRAGERGVSIFLLSLQVIAAAGAEYE